MKVNIETPDIGLEIKLDTDEVEILQKNTEKERMALMYRVSELEKKLEVVTEKLSIAKTAFSTKDAELWGKDCRSQFQLGKGSLFGASYIQSATPNLSLGGEVFWAGQHRKSGIGYAAQYNNDKMVATGQVASTGMVLLSYVQKVHEREKSLGCAKKERMDWT